ncbi:MAG: zf-HC2 domain-containing protein [Bacteroidia bacterium]
MVTCKDVGQKVNLLLDNELPEKEQQEVLEHLRECKSCCELYEAEAHLKNQIRSQRGHHPVPKKVIEEVTAMLSGH